MRRPSLNQSTDERAAIPIQTSSCSSRTSALARHGNPICVESDAQIGFAHLRLQLVHASDGLIHAAAFDGLSNIHAFLWRRK